MSSERNNFLQLFFEAQLFQSNSREILCCESKCEFATFVMRCNLIDLKFRPPVQRSTSASTFIRDLRIELALVRKATKFEKILTTGDCKVVRPNTTQTRK